jgi:primosomal protein N' (replication factor Y)
LKASAMDVEYERISLMTLYEVAVAAPVDQTLTYGHPADRKDAIPVGSCVLVPLGRRRVTGYVLEASPLKRVQKTDFTVKPILDVFAPAPFFPPFLIPLYRWISSYYHHPLGEVIKTALPLAPSAKSGYRINVLDIETLKLYEVSPEKYCFTILPWFQQLLQFQELPPAQIAKIRQDKAQNKQLQILIKSGAVELVPELIASQVKAKKETVYVLAPTFFKNTGLEPTDPLSILQPEDEHRLAQILKPSEKKALTLFLDKYLNTGSKPVARKVLLSLYPNCSKALSSLCAEGILSKHDQRVYRDPFGNTITTTAQPLELTAEQKKVLQEITPSIAAGEFQPFLLFGVTGCGKTEVYLRAAEAALQQGKTALVLVPEIALASQLEAQFYTRFGDQLALFHSGLSQGERLDQWQRVRDGSAKVVLGARSAVFAPMDKLGVVIVDEEHEPAYKQEDGPRYHGRDVAVMRAKLTSCPVILGSATPSVTSYSNTIKEKYKLLTITKRVQEKPLPTVAVVDLSTKKRSRRDLFFSDTLIREIGNTLDNKQQALLFVNRRGFSSTMLCRDCGHVLQCRHCQVSLTYHRSKGRLLCHYCGFTMPSQIICPGCRSQNVAGVGIGAERIEEEAKQLFPAARVARLDSDVAVKRKKYLEILQSVRNKEIDILVGTQMIAKGLHFPNITLVGVIWADAGFTIPDYKAGERTFSLLSQVTGRAGRGDQPGKVIIQTNQPSHYAIRFAQDHNYEALYEQEITTRSPMGFPPFSRMINIKFNGTDETKVEKAARKTAAFIHEDCKQHHIDLLGPSPSPVGKIKDKFRWQLLLKSASARALHAVCTRILDERRSLCLSNVRMVVDVDPENMM